MAVQVKRKDRETVGAFVRRFSRAVQLSGILRRAREVRYYRKPKNKNQRKWAALRREELRKQYEKNKKLGKV